MLEIAQIEAVLPIPVIGTAGEFLLICPLDVGDMPEGNTIIPDYGHVSGSEGPEQNAIIPAVAEAALMVVDAAPGIGKGRYGSGSQGGGYVFVQAGLSGRHAVMRYPGFARPGLKAVIPSPWAPFYVHVRSYNQIVARFYGSPNPVVFSRR
jgi:hypothetical protein